MKMDLRRKVFACMLSLTLAAGVSGCGSSGEEPIADSDTTTTTAATTIAVSETEAESTTTTTEPIEASEPETETTEPIDISETETETTTAEPEEEEKYFTVEECIEKLIRENYGKEIDYIAVLQTVGVLEVYTTDGDYVTIGIDLDLYRSGEKVNIDNFVVYNHSIDYHSKLNL